MSEVAISRKGQQRLEQGHLWLYRSDLIVGKHEAEPGSIVRVIGARQQLMGQAFYSSQSQIALRMLTMRGEKINQKFWRARLQDALELRQTIVKDAEAYRLVHGEGDLIPSLIIDRYQDYFVIQMLSQGTEALRDTWVELLQELFQPKAIVERDDVRVRALEGLPERVELLAGALPDELIVTQHGVKYAVDLMGGQKTGLFLDQRENHAMARRYAGRRALDCFTFAGGFALNMAKSATSVLGLDISETAVAQARKNAALNNADNVKFETANIFDQLKIFDEQHERFDTIVLDPPAFAKNRAAIEAATRGYKEINLRALKLLTPGGILITCTCSYNVSEDLFLGLLQSAAADAGRRVQLLEKRMQGRDHPVLLSVPESYYLKCVVLRVI